MTLTQTAARAALIEELALMVARHRMDIPADFEGMAESNAAPAMRIRNSCAKLEASPASDARKSSAPQSRLSLGCCRGAGRARTSIKSEPGIGRRAPGYVRRWRSRGRSARIRPTITQFRMGCVSRTEDVRRSVEAALSWRPRLFGVRIDSLAAFNWRRLFSPSANNNQNSGADG